MARIIYGDSDLDVPVVDDVGIVMTSEIRSYFGIPRWQKFRLSKLAQGQASCSVELQEDPAAGGPGNAGYVLYPEGGPLFRLEV